ncbi:MAG: hypothetical protein KF901_05840 [Myxococcales bacterium]|nr:hypothetical protein [Myxococcales bacterium]
MVLPDDGFIRWLFDAGAWLVRAYGGFASFRQQSLVTPTAEDFPVDPSLEGMELAEDYLLFVLEHMGLQEWPLYLVADQPPEPAAILAGMPHGMTGEVEEAPSLVHPEDGMPIPVDPALLSDPELLVALLARGASHYFVADQPAPLGDHDELVDLATVLSGFGIFLANGALRFHHASSGPLVGWGFRRFGALAEHELAYALALFGVVCEVPDRDIEAHLRPNPREFHHKAVKHLLRHHASGLDRLRGVEPATIGPYR